MARATAAVVSVLLLTLSAPASAQSLRGSRTTMHRQNAVARQHDYTFLRTSAQVSRFVDLGLLVRLSGNAHYELARVSYPYARPAVKLFVERLAAQYYAACGERLVVTSLTRPEAKQPRNASDLSVHPAGMAVDLRISRRADCRKWLESTLLSLEKQGVIDGTRERYPPHYHVAVFPQPYEGYVAALTRRSGAQLAAAAPKPKPQREAQQAGAVAQASADVADEAGSDAAAARHEAGSVATLASVTEAGAAAAPAADDVVETYEVRRGDTLWGIARRFGLTVEALKETNKLGSARIMAGQTLQVAAAAPADPAPATDAAEAAAGLVAIAAAEAAGSPASGPAEPPADVPADVPAAAPAAEVIEYRVRPGDTLWEIARRHGITVEQLQSANGLASARIVAGQTLELPTP